MLAYSLRNILKEQITFLAISFSAFATQPGIVYAQMQDYNPTVFTEPLNLSRGSLSPGFLDGKIFPKQDYCRIMLDDWGWESCDGVDAVLIGHVAEAGTTIVFSPDSSGYVKFDDWNTSDRSKEISQIEESLETSLAAQSEKTGDDITFGGWRTQPTLNQERSYLYYAIDLVWNGEVQTNIKATIFDRKGYTIFAIVPIRSDLSSAETEHLINLTLDRYTPTPEQSYAAFQNGDKVAAVGALGVLATLVGVKYGKTALAAIVGIGILFLKKGAFLLLLPLLWIGRLFRRKQP